jgi:hypothetical protein
MEKRNSHLPLKRESADALEVLRIEADVAVHIAIALHREYDRAQQRGQATNSAGRRPQPKREVLLMIRPDQMRTEGRVDVLRNGDRVFTLHLEISG